MNSIVDDKSQYLFKKPSEQLASSLESNHALWLQYGSNPFAQAWLRNSIAYYSAILEANDWQSALGFAGEQGELVKMVVPQARSLIRQIVTLATKQRLYFRAIAESTDSDTATATKIANALCEQLVHDQNLDKKREYAVEGAQVSGAMFYKVAWRTDKGTPYFAEERVDGEEDSNEFSSPYVYYDGDVEVTVHDVYDIYYDTRVKSWDQLNWVEVRTVKNRWDMIASYPDLKDHILALPRIMEVQGMSQAQGIGCENEDLIYVFEAYHKPSPALPKGRLIAYGDSKTIFYDGENPYERIPVIPLMPEQVQGMLYGYPKLSDLLPAQEMFDHSLSAIATNQSACAVQSILCPRDANISANQIGGMNFIFFTPANATGGGEPKALQLTQSAPETFKFAELVAGYMQQLSNLNSTVRGAPPPGVTSGTAIATLTANALEFMNSLSKADQIALEQVMDLAVFCYAKFTTIPRLVTMVGKGNQAYAKEFLGKDLQSIKKVRILTSNPLMNTIAGRADVAEKLLGSGLIKTPQSYFNVLEGMPVEHMYETELSTDDLINKENENLMDGKPVIVLSLDDHAAHVQKHKCLLNDPAIRFNNQAVSGILNHILDHEKQAKEVDPYLYAMAQTGKIPQGAPPPPPGPSGPGPSGPGGPPMPMQPLDEKPASPAKDQVAGMRQ